jgi:glycine cleavage system transcriptional repressor
MFMDRYAMLTAFGQDRPGIVAAVAEGLFQLRCNIEDTCMTRLREEFTMMVMVKLPTEVLPDQLATRMASFTDPLGLTVLCREVPKQTPLTQTDATTYMLSVYGADRPGIVAKVARLVADHGGNITDMNTRVIGTPERPVYVMLLEVLLPSTQEPTQLESALQGLKVSLDVDVSFRTIEQLRF